MLHFKVCTAYSSPNKDKKLKSFVLWWEIQFAHKVLSIECSKSKTKSEHKVLFTKVFQHCACIVWWKSQFAHKGEYSNWGKTRNMEGRTLFQKTPTLFLWKCQNLAFHPIQIKWQRFESKTLKWPKDIAGFNPPSLPLLVLSATLPSIISTSLLRNIKNQILSFVTHHFLAAYSEGQLLFCLLLKKR